MAKAFGNRYCRLNMVLRGVGGILFVLIIVLQDFGEGSYQRRIPFLLISNILLGLRATFSFGSTLG